MAFNVGQIVYSGYPTSHVQIFTRNKKGKLTLSNAKHLLWGDWVKVTDETEQLGNQEILRNADEKKAARKLAKNLIPVHVRGVSGYMEKVDIQTEPLLEIVFVDVGQGDGALLITPDDKKYVIDAGEGDNMYRYLNWRFSSFDNAKNDFEGFIVTHPDKDHYNGFSKLINNQDVQCNNIWHNGIVEQYHVSASGKQFTNKKYQLGETKVEAGQRYLTGLVETDAQLKALLSDQDRWVKKTSGRGRPYPDMLNDALNAKDGSARRFPNIEMLSTAHGELHEGKSYLPGCAPTDGRDYEIRIIGPVVEPDAAGDARLRAFSAKPAEKTTGLDVAKTKNGQSVLLRLEYKNLTILFGGDLNSSAEMFLLNHYTGLPVYDPLQVRNDEVVEAAKYIFQSDIAKACHHGSADFTDHFLQTINASATVVSSGDNESHAHPRSDTLGAIGHHGRGQRSLIFSTELARSTAEFTNRKDSPWYQGVMLKADAEKEEDPVKKAELLEQSEEKFKKDRKYNVTVYGAINVRTDGERVVLAYMLEKPSKSRRWDVYTLESTNGGMMQYKPVKQAEKDEEKRRENVA